MKCWQRRRRSNPVGAFFRCFIENVCTEQKEKEELPMMETISNVIYKIDGMVWAGGSLYFCLELIFI